jgi:hypothetical protein
MLIKFINLKKDYSLNKSLFFEAINEVGQDADFILGKSVSKFEKSVCEYLKIKLPSKNIISIINYYGYPYYIKIDLEHYDSIILKELFFKKIYPKYLSIESHTREILDIITQDSTYKSFKLVDGSQVHKKYKNCVVNNTRYIFPQHSAGPFGNDIDGHWLEKSNFCFLLSVIGFGAKDIHCSLEDKPSKYYLPLEIILYTKRKIIRRFVVIFIIILIVFALIYLLKI